MISQGNLGKITCPTYFVAHNRAKEMLVRFIKVTQVPQAPSAFKSQTKIIFDVGGFHFAPSMTIILAVHALHLFRMVNWNTNGKESKNDVVIKCDGHKGNIWNFDFDVVQRPQLL